MARDSGGEHAGRPGGAPQALRPRELLATLGDHDVEFVVIGGLALAPHGYVRATKDLDVVPDPQPANLSRLASALRTLEARVDVGDHAVLYAGYDELISMKVAAGREQDLRDVGALEAARRSG